MVADPQTGLPRDPSKPIFRTKTVFQFGANFCLVEKKGYNSAVEMLLDQSPIEPSSLNDSIDSL